MPQWVKTSERLPISEEWIDVGAKYYLVKVNGYGTTLAMFLDEEWYTSYISKIILPVEQWLEDRYKVEYA